MTTLLLTALRFDRMVMRPRVSIAQGGQAAVLLQWSNTGQILVKRPQVSIVQGGQAAALLQDRADVVVTDAAEAELLAGWCD